MLGALGSAVAVGLGLAMAQPERHVYVIDGDGSMFFNPNQMYDIASFNPSNFTLVCLDNGSWGSTGNQPTLSSKGYNLTAFAQSAAIESTAMTDQVDELHKGLQGKVRFMHYFIEAGNDKVGAEIPLKAVAIKQRFMNAVT
jgi:sulfopyruvate decarboxylase subunit beta